MRRASPTVSGRTTRGARAGPRGRPTKALTGSSLSLPTCCNTVCILQQHRVLQQHRLYVLQHHYALLSKNTIMRCSTVLYSSIVVYCNTQHCKTSETPLLQHYYCNTYSVTLLLQHHCVPQHCCCNTVVTAAPLLQHLCCNTIAAVTLMFDAPAVLGSHFTVMATLLLQHLCCNTIAAVTLLYDIPIMICWRLILVLDVPTIGVFCFRNRNRKPANDNDNDYDNPSSSILWQRQRRQY